MRAPENTPQSRFQQRNNEHVRETLLDNTFRLLEEIGRGGFGAVYRAVRMGAEGSGSVAIKLLSKNPGVKSEEYLRFQREAVLMSQLVHPGVVAVYELGEEAGCYFIVMEYVSGKNLREHVKIRGGRLPLTDILEILVQAAEALEYVHGHNIVHRDIKPQNILVAEGQGASVPFADRDRYQVKIVDFGVARLGDVARGVGVAGAQGAHAVTPGGTPGGAPGVISGAVQGAAQPGEVVGTYNYMPPEATGLVDWPVDARSDVYSLGVVAYELLAGRTPFSDLKPHEIMRAHVEKTPAPIRSVRGHDVPRILEDIIQKCMEKRPENRYQSMFALVCDLRRLQSSLRTVGVLEDFELASKDIGLGTLFNRVYVGRRELTESVFQFVLRHVGSRTSRLSWGMLRGGVGVGKSRIIEEVRARLESTDLHHISLRFSESEQRLPFQALSLCLNDHLMHMERYDAVRHRALTEAVGRRLGEEGVLALAGLLPALRSLVAHLPVESRVPRPLSHEVPADDSSDAELSSLDVLPEGGRYAAPNARMNQAFREFITCIAQESGHFVFLLDDVHLADSSTLALLQFLAEQVNDPVGFTILMTMRDKLPRSHLVLEGFLRRVGGLRRRFHAWDIGPLDSRGVGEFLIEMGFVSPSEKFISFVIGKTLGTPLQLHALLKSMLAQNALLVRRDAGLPRGYELVVDWDVVPHIDNSIVNIEMIISQVETLDKRDLRLLRIAAVSHEACEFEYFRMDPDFSRLELETRLPALVRRGFLESIGDLSGPIGRLAFAYGHEKIRNAILQSADANTRKEIHLCLAKHIEGLYKNPRREQVLLLAKHYDGAGSLVEPEVATRAFLRAVRIYVRGQGYNLAKYYIEKTLSRAREIADQHKRMVFLREVFEAEYSIYAASGNFVAASDVCEQLIAITEDIDKQELLKTFWAQLLLALGRHVKGQAQATEVLVRHGIHPQSFLLQAFSRWNLRFFGTRLHRYISRFVLWLFPLKETPDVALQALALKGLAELHGVEEPIEETLFFGMRAQVMRRPSSRWTAVYAMIEASLHLRAGVVDKSYRTAEKVERYLESRGHGDALRWARALRALWLDYPLGRTDRLLSLLEGAKESQLPTSGLLHFESGALRSWMRLLSPASSVAKAADAGEQKGRRKKDENREAAVSPAELLLENQNARRVLDAGENGQYTALALFSDALRYALFDKLEPLKRATEQLRRQEASSSIGEAFCAFASSLHALVSGRHKESLEKYHAALQCIALARPSVISLPVSDGLRLAAFLLPLFAVGAQARGWPWGSGLRMHLLAVDARLRPAEGLHNPRRGAMSALFDGFLAYMSGDRKKAFERLGQAVSESRSQRLELLEALSLVVLGTFCAQMKLVRAKEHFLTAHRTAKGSGWRLLERQIEGLANRLKLDMGNLWEKEKTPPGPSEGRSAAGSVMARSSLLTSGGVFAGMQRLSEKDSLESLLKEAALLASRTLGLPQAAVFLLENDDNGRTRFVCRFHTHAVAQNFDLQARGAGSRREIFLEQDMAKLLTRTFDEPVKLVPLQDTRRDSQKAADSHVPTVAHGGVAALSSAPTVAHGAAVPLSGEPTAAPSTRAPRSVAPGSLVPLRSTLERRKFSQTRETLEPRQGDPLCLVAVAIPFGETLLGWIVLPGTTLSHYARKDVEQDLVLLGLHCGYLVRSFQKQDKPPAAVRVSGETSLRAQEASKALVDGDLPEGILVETFGLLESRSPLELMNERTHVKVYGLPRGRLLVVQWSLEGRESKDGVGSKEDVERLDALLSRHVEFFVTSSRSRQETSRLASLSLRLASDIASLFEGFQGLKALDDIAFGFVLVAPKEELSIEGLFGTERFSFTGSARVENEFLHEVASMRGGKLIYRERARRLGRQAGWMFAADDVSSELLPSFTRADFLDRYLVALKNQRKEPPSEAGLADAGIQKSENVLPRLLLLHGGDPLVRSEGREGAAAPRCVCVFIVGEEDGLPGLRVS